jgi:hypothetical protein
MLCSCPKEPHGGKVYNLSLYGEGIWVERKFINAASASGRIRLFLFSLFILLFSLDLRE